MMGTILIDMLRDWRSQKQAFPGHGDPLAPTDVMPELPRGAKNEAALVSLKHALEAVEKDLSPVHRSIVELKFMGECTVDQIAAITALNRTKVRVMLNLAMVKMRKELEISFPEFGHADVISRRRRVIS